jgi:hypothetical protein
MSVSELSLDSFFAALQERFPSLLARLSLSAKRDLFTKALWGVAYSQVMKRARDGKLSPFILDSVQIAAAAHAFNVDPKLLLQALVQCNSAYDAMRDAVTSAITKGGSVVALVAEQGPARDGALLALVSIITEATGNRGYVMVLHTHDLRGFDSVVSRARHTCVPRKSGSPFAIELRNEIRGVHRMAADIVGFDAIDNAVVAREAGALIAGARASFIVADRPELVEAAMRSAGRSISAGRPSVSRVLIRITDEKLVAGALHVSGDRRPNVFASAPARSAAFLLDFGQRIGARLVVDDNALEMAAQLTLDEIGKLADQGRAHDDIRHVLMSADVDAATADVLARQLIDRMQSLSGAQGDVGMAANDEDGASP